MNERKLSLLISIKPRFADAIFDGKKRVELRRKRPKVQSGSFAVVYVSSPVKAITGMFRIGTVISGPVDNLWDFVRDGACINQKEYRDYFLGAVTAHALTIVAAERLLEPVPLCSLKGMHPDFRPPQSYVYNLPPGLESIDQVCSDTLLRSERA